MEYSIIEIQDNLRKLQSQKRYLHSLGVQYTAASLAMRYGYDIRKAEITGLLHDCAKYMPNEEMLNKCKKYLLPVTEVEEKSPFLLHAKLGAFYAKNKYNIKEQEILNAITYHTTGRIEMTMLDKIVYIADYIEPYRQMLDGLDEIRKVSFDNLDEAVYLILKSTLNYLNEDPNRAIDPMTEKAFNYYCGLCK